jgi:outer membrane protein assembly factor BamE (lipoprotein component of BamABCDE complex)
MLKKALVVIMLTFLAGCMPRIYSETGQRFERKNFDDVAPGKTTKSDLISTLGEPQQTGIKESGKEMWTYLFLSLDYPSKCLFTTTSPEIKHEFMRITITFDGDTVFEKSFEMTKKAKE